MAKILSGSIGGLEAVDPTLIPIGMVQLFRTSRMKLDDGLVAPPGTNPADYAQRQSGARGGNPRGGFRGRGGQRGGRVDSW
jgi:hypothetical protein